MISLLDLNEATYFLFYGWDTKAYEAVYDALNDDWAVFLLTYGSPRQKVYG